MTSGRTTLYLALNNTQLEHFVDQIDYHIRLWPYLLWPVPLDPEWKVEHTADATISTAQTSDEDVMIFIYRQATGISQCLWFVTNSRSPELMDKVFTVYVARYQQDRVEVTVVETHDQKVKDIVLGWIEKHWKDKYEVLDPNDALPQHAAVAPVLTDTEMQIAVMLAHGMDDKAISEERVISQSTVETHRKNIARKLRISADKNNIGEILKGMGFASV